MASTVDLVSGSQPTLPQKKTFSTMTNSERIAYLKNVITLEPLVICYVMAGGFSSTALYCLELEKACKVDAGYNDTICESIVSSTFAEMNFTKENSRVQEIIANMHSWQETIQSVVPIILALFLGAFSDRHRIRKPFLLLPLAGEMCSVIGCALCAIFMRDWPLLALGFSQTILPSFFGGQTMFVVALFSYIADVSSVEMRTIRLTVLQLVLNLFFPAALALSGQLYVATGYLGVLSVVGLFFLLGFLYVVFWIEETNKVMVEDKKAFLKDIFNPKHLVDTFNLLIKKTPGNHRIDIYILLAVILISLGVDKGENSLFFLYTQSLLEWTGEIFNYFNSLNYFIRIAGTAVGVPIFTKVFKWSDYTITNVAFLDKIISNLVMAFATTSTMMYTGSIVGLMNGIDNVALRSVATKVVSENDLAKTQSLLAVAEAIGNAIASMVYNKLYVVTKDSIPGIFLVLGAILLLVCIVLVFIMGVTYKRRQSPQNEKISSEKKGLEMGVVNPMPISDETTHI